jgi:ABC-type transporter Mla subunit MlaD
MTQAARDALRRVDTLLSDNAAPLHDATGNIGTFAEALARNSSRLDGIVAGLERMTRAARRGARLGHVRFFRRQRLCDAAPSTAGGPCDH